MRDLTIREATSRDVRALAQLHFDAWHVAYRPILHQDHLDWVSLDREVRRKRTHLKNGVPILVAEKNDQILGFLVYEFDKPDEKEIPSGTWDIHSFWVHHEHTRKGIGSKLLKEMIERASPQRIHVWVLTGVPEGPSFYEKHRFRPDEDTRQDFIFLDHPMPMVRYVRRFRKSPKPTLSSERK